MYSYIQLFCLLSTVSGGDVSVIVASSKDNKLVPVREAFQKVFGKATVTGKVCFIQSFC